MAASWLQPHKTPCACYMFTHISVLFSSSCLCHCPSVSCSCVCVCVCVYMRMCVCVCPVLLCSLPHPGGLASVLYRRCSSLPQSHLAPLPKRTPPPQACIAITTTITAPHFPPTTSNHNASTLPKRLINFYLFFPLLTFFLLLPTQLICFSLTPYFLPTLYPVNCMVYHYFIYPVDSARSVSGVVMLLMRTRFPLLPGSLI